MSEQLTYHEERKRSYENYKKHYESLDEDERRQLFHPSHYFHIPLYEVQDTVGYIVRLMATDSEVEYDYFNNFMNSISRGINPFDDELMGKIGLDKKHWEELIKGYTGMPLDPKLLEPRAE